MIKTFDRDENDQNILQLTIEGTCCDPPAVLSILKTFPDFARIKDEDGILPIEKVCMQGLQSEIIIALALVDLPLDLDFKEDLAFRKGYGASWWFLTCECDDAHVNVVKEILAIGSYQQTRELCFVKSKNGSSVISRATPKCKLEMRKVLRFGGQYEFTSSKAVRSNSVQGLEVFKALDFGSDENPIDDGRKVFLKCYQKESFLRDVSIAFFYCFFYSHHVYTHLFFLDKRPS